MKTWGGKSEQGVGDTGPSGVLSKCRWYHTSRQVLHFPTCPAFQDVLKGQNESVYNLGPGGSFKSKYIIAVHRAHGVIISHFLGLALSLEAQAGFVEVSLAPETGGDILHPLARWSLADNPREVCPGSFSLPGLSQ